MSATILPRRLDPELERIFQEWKKLDQPQRDAFAAFLFRYWDGAVDEEFRTGLRKALQWANRRKVL